MSVADGVVEDVWRRESPHVLAALLRRYGGFEDCEDALQEALVAASVQWPRDGLPRQPRAWLVRVASRRLIDVRRSESTRRTREARDALGTPADAHLATPADVPVRQPATDDTVHLLLLCCHPDLTVPSQIALALRAVGGLTTRQIAAAFLVPEATMAQRISRAKHQVRDGFEPPTVAQLPDRLAAVLQVLHLLVTEAHTTSAGASVVDRPLADEAVRLIRHVHSVVPDHDEATGLLALALLTRARSMTRTDDRGELVPLQDQDRARWDAAAVAEATALLERVLPRGPVGTFQLQAAIAAVHAEAPSWDQTDWSQIVELYRMLDHVAPGATVTLGMSVALARRDGPAAGLDFLEAQESKALRQTYRTDAVRGHLLAEVGRVDEAVEALRRAASATASIPEQRYLNRHIVALSAQ